MSPASQFLNYNNESSLEWNSLGKLQNSRFTSIIGITANVWLLLPTGNRARMCAPPHELTVKATKITTLNVMSLPLLIDQVWFSNSLLKNVYIQTVFPFIPCYRSSLWFGVLCFLQTLDLFTNTFEKKDNNWTLVFLPFTLVFCLTPCL